MCLWALVIPLTGVPCPPARRVCRPAATSSNSQQTLPTSSNPAKPDLIGLSPSKSQGLARRSLESLRLAEPYHAGRVIPTRYDLAE